ncbi:MAG: flagellar basal body P-ring formation protein FlgA [Phycisphaeraceae bacterium]|nr:MAG: flagellar basal body P-ring formation protein FlgA [Phycisphaeraceae bacterium]
MPRPLAILAQLLLALTAVAQDAVVLRPDARLDPAQPIRLRDVADLRGPAAVALADTLVWEAWAAAVAPDTGLALLDAARVKKALDAAAGASASRLTFRGSACLIRPISAAPEPSPRDAPSGPAGDAPDGPTLKDLIAPRLAVALGVDEQDLRLTFDPASAALLATPITGRTTDLHPAGMSDRVPMTARVFEGDRLVASGTVRVGVEVKRTVAVARRTLTRGQTIGPDDVSAEDRWVGPAAALASPADAEGSAVKNRLTAGQPIASGDLEPAVVVRKGDLVAVTCLAGAVSLRTTARAASDARTGEVIRFEALDDRKRSFRARVSGPGRAVATTAGAEEPPATTTSAQTAPTFPDGGGTALERPLRDEPPAALAAAPTTDWAHILRDAFR